MDLKALLGDWISRPADDHPASRMICRRQFQEFGASNVRLEASWGEAGREYQEFAIFGVDDQGKLSFWSFTSDGKRSVGSRCDGGDVHPDAIAFDAMMPAGRARFVYWPTAAGAGFHFAAESQAEAGWNRFLTQLYAPAI